MAIHPLILGLIGLGELLLTVLIGFTAIWLAFHLYFRLIGRPDREKALTENNQAIGITLAAFIFGTAILFKRSFYPVFTVLKNLTLYPQVSAAGVWGSVGFCVGYLLVSLVVSLLAAFLSFRMLDLLTKSIKELEEIRSNNQTIAVFYSGIFLSLCFLIEEGLHALLITLMPLPAIGIL